MDIRIFWSNTWIPKAEDYEQNVPCKKHPFKNVVEPGGLLESVDRVAYDEVYNEKLCSNIWPVWSKG